MIEVYTDRDSNPTRPVNCEPVTSYLLIKNLCGKRFARGGLITIDRSKKKGGPETQRTSTIVSKCDLHCQKMFCQNLCPVFSRFQKIRGGV